MAFKTVNPANLQILKEYSYHSVSEVFEKLPSFSQQQQAWSSLSVRERALVLKKLAQSLQNQKKMLALQATREMGKPISDSIKEIEKCALGLEMLADLAVENLNEKELAAQYAKTLIRPEPYGLVLSIQPWNFPYWQVFRMAACAWMAGNLVVLKHAEEVAGCAELIEEICKVEGTQLLLNFRLTHQDTAELMKSSYIQAVTFTGSTSGGKNVAATAGGALKKVILELGGSDAYIVMPDCQLDWAVHNCVQTRMINSGQSCIAGKRFFIHESIFSEFKKKFKEKLSSYKIGDPEKSDTQVGPLAAKRFLQSLAEQTKRAQHGGAKLEWTQHEIAETGYFTRLGILDFGSALKVFENEEIFGPVASFYRFNDLDEVLKVINQGPYGLGGGIFTQDMKLAKEISHKMRVGTFTINSFVSSDARVPFGGTKESGIGREMGLEGLHDFVSWKVVGQA